MTTTSVRMLLAVLVAIFAVGVKSSNPFEPEVLFDLNFAQELASEAAAELNNFRIKTSSAEEYECYLPRTSLDEGASTDDSVDELSGTTPAHPVQLLQPLQSNCLFRLEPYWTYEVCIGKHVRQFHEEKYTVAGKKKVKLTEFFLGRNPMGVEELKGDADVKHMNIDDDDVAYYGELYGHGDVCDLTGQPRETEVRFICDQDTRHTVVAFAETSTCRYQITVATSLLCDNPNYVEEEPETSDITCKPINGAPTKPLALASMEEERNALEKEAAERARAARAAQEAQEAMLVKPTDIPTSKNTVRKVPERPPSKKPVDKNLIKKVVRGTACFHGGGHGWWKFEFCPQQHVRQYHVHPDGRKEYILLGAWEPEQHVARMQEEKAAKRTRSFIHHYHDGAHCDAIKASRRVDVRYVCSSSMEDGQVTLTLEEKETCVYVMTFRSTVVCEMLPLLDENRIPQLP